MRFFSSYILWKLIVKLMVHSLLGNTEALIIISHSHETELLFSIKDTAIKWPRQSRERSWIYPMRLSRSFFPISDTLWPIVIKKVSKWGMHIINAMWVFKLWNISILYPDYYRLSWYFPRVWSHNFIDSRFLYHKKS